MKCSLALTFLGSLLCIILSSSLVFAADKLGVAIPYPVSRIDPLLLDEPINRIILSQVGVGLTRVGTNAEAELEVALGLSSEDSGKRWVVELRPEVHFSSLGEVTPERVRSSADFLKNISEESGSDNFLASSLKNLLRIEVREAKHARYPNRQEPLELAFVLEKSDPNFPMALAYLPIVDSDLARSFGVDFGVGTNLSSLGPYQIRENRPDAGVLIERAPDFYEPGRPRVEHIEFRFFEESGEALKALRVGGVDIIAIPTPSQIEDIKEDPTLITMQSPLVNLKQVSGPWKLRKTHWSDNDSESERLTTEWIIVRKSLQIDNALRARFDLSGTYLP